MAETLQRITLIGRITEPEMRYTPSGIPVTNFSLATTNLAHKERQAECPTGWKQAYGEEYWELTTWWRVTCWQYLAESTNKRLNKGDKVYVEGTMGGKAENGVLGANIWSDKEGKPRANFEVTAKIVVFVAKSNGHTPRDEDVPMKISGVPQEDNLPF